MPATATVVVTLDLTWHLQVPETEAVIPQKEKSVFMGAKCQHVWFVCMMAKACLMLSPWGCSS